MKHIFVVIILFIFTPLFSQNIEKLSLHANNADKGIIKIYTLDENGNYLGQGSGCLISADGIGISNFHVLAGFKKAIVVLSDGTKYDISTIIDYNEKSDLVKFKLRIGNANITPFLTMGLSEPQKAESVFAIGYPNGFSMLGESTISTGIISGFRSIDGIRFIQTSTPFTHGSSGGGLFDKNGKLVGITSGTYANDIRDRHANLNKVVPISEVIKLNRSLNLTLSSFYKELVNDVYFVTATEYYENNQWGEAGLMFLEHLKIYPEDALAWFRLGMCNYQLYRSVGNNELANNAELNFKYSIELNNTFYYGHGQLAKLYMLLERIDEAKYYTESCYSLAPETSFAQYIMASYYGHQSVRNYPLAIKYYTQAIEISIDEGDTYGLNEAYFERANSYLSNKEDVKALVDYEACLRLNPEHTGSLWQVAVYYANNGNKTAACNYISKLNMIIPNQVFHGSSVNEWRNLWCNSQSSSTNKKQITSTDKQQVDDNLTDIVFSSDKNTFFLRNAADNSVLGYVGVNQPLSFKANKNTAYAVDIYYIKNNKAKYKGRLPVHVSSGKTTVKFSKKGKATINYIHTR